MLELIGILGLPFLACITMGTILGYLGIHVLKREVIFIDIALAQIAAVGSIAGRIVFEAHRSSLLGYVCSLSCVLLAAAFYAGVRKKVVQISLEAVIGISYAIAAAAALFLIGVAAPGGHLHVQQMLAGSLLWAGWRNVTTSLELFSAVGFVCLVFRKPLNRISDDYHGAAAAGMNILWWDFLFYSVLGLVITSAVRVAGVVAVFALLIIPATISALFSRRWVGRMLIAWVATAIASAGGLLLAYYLDFSIGPAVALFLGCELIIAALYHRQQTLIKLE